jgi:hypothetical protein
MWKRAGVLGAVIASRGTVEQVEQWIAAMPRQQVLAQMFLCPKFVADSRTHAIGFTADGLAVIQYEPSRFPPGRHLRFYKREDVTVTSTTQGLFTAVYVGDELFQVGHADAEALRALLRNNQVRRVEGEV